MGERAAGERARPAATFQRIIIVISLGGLDSVVPSRERKKEMRITERWGERRDMGEWWSRVGRRGRHIRRRKKRIIEKQSREGNRTRIWKWREALDSSHSHSVEERRHRWCLFLSLFFGEIVYYTKCMDWGIHTLSDHLSIPHIGEKCMCEVSNNRIHCLYSNETNVTGHTEGLIYITHIMRDFTHLPSHRDILAHT